MFEMITAIALWCSNPAYNALSKNAVNECRAQILECLRTAKSDPEGIICFAKTKIKE